MEQRGSFKTEHKALITNTNAGCITMDSREIAELTDKLHKNVCRDIKKQLEEQKIDRLNFELTYLDVINRPQPCYQLDYEQTMILLTGYSVKLRAKVVKRWQELESNSKPKLPTHVEALRLYADQLEENQRLLIEKKEDKPKVDFYNQVTESTATIAMGQVAKVLNIKGLGRNKLFRLFRLLKDLKILQENRDPYQEYINRGYFRIIEQKYTKPNGRLGISFKTIVYQKGLDYILKRVKEVINE